MCVAKPENVINKLRSRFVAGLMVISQIQVNMSTRVKTVSITDYAKHALATTINACFPENTCL